MSFRYPIWISHPIILLKLPYDDLHRKGLFNTRVRRVVNVLYNTHCLKDMWQESHFSPQIRVHVVFLNTSQKVEKQEPPVQWKVPLPADRGFHVYVSSHSGCCWFGFASHKLHTHIVTMHGTVEAIKPPTMQPQAAALRP